MYWRLVLISLSILSWSQAYFIERCTADEPPVCAISGHIVTDDGAYPGWVVFDTSDGTIIDICDGQEDVPPGAIVVEHDGYIFPGLIDTHNHCHWNSVPMWRPGRLFNNRYEWQATLEYREEVRWPYNDIYYYGLWYESFKYGEIRALIGGTTMIEGTDDWDPDHLVRNLDWDWGVYSYIPDITQADPSLIKTMKRYLKKGLVNRIFLHVAEGTDFRSWLEFQFLVDEELTIPGVVIIHGIALTQDDFATMAENDMYLVWSPKTNLVLYGETADVLGALDAGVTVALGPDWTISGSDNLLEELKVAYQYSVEHLDGAITPRQLFKMATCDAAIVGGVDDQLGKIEVGFKADLFLAPKFDPDPHVSLLKTYPKDIELVVIDGVPFCGKRQEMEKWFPAEDLDEIVVNEKKKSLHLFDPTIGFLGEQRYDEMVELLEGVLEEMAPLVEDEPGAQLGFPRSLP